MLLAAGISAALSVWLSAVLLSYAARGSDAVSSDVVGGRVSSPLSLPLARAKLIFIISAAGFRSLAAVAAL